MEIPNNECIGKNIVFISDLHFDFVKDTTAESGHRYAPELSERIKDDFIKYVKEKHSNDIVCLAGDFYTSFQKTLSFIKEMEQNNILGFFVLGNHDYWHKPAQFTHEEIVKIFEEETIGHCYFKFLSTGKKYYIDDVCFIGDTGWTSFRRLYWRFTKRECVRDIKNLKQFMQLIDATLVRDFDPVRIKQFHNDWIKFANSILQKEEKVFILTHYPMFDITQEDSDCWWSSTTDLLDQDNCWKVFGHIHSNHERGNNITSQRGYQNKVLKENTPQLREEIYNDILKREHWWQEKDLQNRLKELKERKQQKGEKVTEEDIHKLRSKVPQIKNREQKIDLRVDYELKQVTTQYSMENFGVLIKLSDRRDLLAPFQYVLSKHYSSSLVKDPNEETQLVNSVRRSGYRRPSANKVNFAYLSEDKEGYLEKVRKVIELSANQGDTRIGYYYKLAIKGETIATLNACADYLEKHDILDDVRAFITSAIITGYAWNELPQLIEKMRPVNDYDIARFFLQFVTMKKYNINFRNIRTIERSQDRKDKIAFGNVDLPLPVINGKMLTIEDVMLELGQTPLLALVNPDGNKYKVICKRCGAELERRNREKPNTCENCRKVTTKTTN